MNDVQQLHQLYSYAEIAERIKAATGRRYSIGHLTNVANGSRKVSDALRYNLNLAFPEFFLKRKSLLSEVVASVSEIV